MLRRLVGVYYGMVRASVCLSHKSYKHDTDWTVPARTVKLGTITSYDKRTTPIDFQGQGKGQGYTLDIVVKPCKHIQKHQQKLQKGKVTTQTTPQKSSITQQLRTDLGRSVGVTTATQLVWLTWFTGPPSHSPQQPCNEKDTHLKICK